VFGSVFVARLGDELADAVPDPAALPAGGVDALSPQVLAGLPVPVQEAVAHAFGEALPPIFLLGLPVAAVCLVLALFIREIPLGTTVDAEPAEAPAEVPGESPGRSPGRAGG
jgi:hypothetical protein